MNAHLFRSSTGSIDPISSQRLQFGVDPRQPHLDDSDWLGCPYTQTRGVLPAYLKVLYTGDSPGARRILSCFNIERYNFLYQFSATLELHYMEVANTMPVLSDSVAKLLELEFEWILP
ncbi:hypothetical protein Tco_1460367, partial [Tanacetum coccineum]